MDMLSLGPDERISPTEHLMEVFHLKRDFRNKDMEAEVTDKMTVAQPQRIAPTDLKESSRGL